LEKDIRLIQNIGHLRDFYRFVRLLAGRCSQPLNMASYSKELGVSVPTIKQWLSVLEASYIVHALPPYSVNLGKSVVKSPKIYFSDVGLVCHLIGLRTEEQVLNSPYVGALYENFCVQEFFKDKFHHNQHNNLYFWRTRNGAEVDLVMEEGNELKLFEFKFTKTIRPLMKNGIESFFKAFPKKKVKQSTIVSLIDEPLQLSQNVAVSNMFDIAS